MCFCDVAHMIDSWERLKLRFNKYTSFLELLCQNENWLTYMRMSLYPKIGARPNIGTCAYIRANTVIVASSNSLHGLQYHDTLLIKHGQIGCVVLNGPQLISFTASLQT
jgi:hypothetical protein